jgi:hypothetical protein
MEEDDKVIQLVIHSHFVDRLLGRLCTAVKSALSVGNYCLANKLCTTFPGYMGYEIDSFLELAKKYPNFVPFVDTPMNI